MVMVGSLGTNATSVPAQDDVLIYEDELKRQENGQLRLSKLHTVLNESSPLPAVLLRKEFERSRARSVEGRYDARLQAGWLALPRYLAPPES